MNKSVSKYLGVFIIYLIIDVLYQFGIGMSLSTQLQEAAGIRSIFLSTVEKPWLILVWFAIMTTAIVNLVVDPAVAKGSASSALKNGLLLGLTAYGTLGLANGWSLADYPLGLVGEVMLEGALFAPITSYVVTRMILKKKTKK